MIALPAYAQRTNVQPAWNLFSPQQDVELGRALAQDAETAFQFVDDPNSNAYIDALGKQLAAHAPGTRYQYQFRIVRDESLNAWALPGGIIYLTTGLLNTAQNEPQLAGILAHEIAHVALRHGAGNVSQEYSNQVSGARNRISVNDALNRLNIRFDANAIPLKYSREQERDADIVAAQMMYDTSFDPRQMTQMFQSIANSDFFINHVNPGNRAAIVRTELRNLGGVPRNLRADSPDFHSVKDRLLAANRENRRPAYDRNRVNTGAPEPPSTRMVVYRDRDIEFRYPENWQVNNGTDSISVGPDRGFVSGSLAWGMTIGVFEPRSGRFGNSFSSPGIRGADTTSLSSATDQLVNYLMQSNPNMRVVRNSQWNRVDGAQAMMLELTNSSPVGGTESDWLVTTLRPNGLLRYFVGVAPQRDFNRYRPTFEDIVTSVRFTD